MTVKIIIRSSDRPTPASGLLGAFGATTKGGSDEVIIKTDEIGIADGPTLTEVVGAATVAFTKVFVEDETTPTFETVFGEAAESEAGDADGIAKRIELIEKVIDTMAGMNVSRDTARGLVSHLLNKGFTFQERA